MLTPFEVASVLAEPLLPALRGKARRRIRRLVDRGAVPTPKILDVGGRRSPYTVGIDADITVVDLPRASEVQHRLALGVTDTILKAIRRDRSNITNVLLEDMTKSTLPDAIYDGVICVEVIEHVPDDQAFVAQIARVLKPGGWLFMTTPNGDYVRNEPPNYNPDHLRHYRRDDLAALLRKHFGEVEVKYGVRTGKHRVRGLRSVNVRHPVRTVVGMLSNVLSRIESRGLDTSPQRRAHLFVEAWKR